MQKSCLKLVTMCAALIVFAAVNCGAQEAKMAYVDMQKFGTKSKRAQETQKKFADSYNQKKLELEQKAKDLMNLKDQLQKQGPMLKEETRAAKIRELQIKELDLQNAQKDAETQLQNEQREAMGIFERELTKIIDQVRIQQRLTFVFNRAAMFAADEALDISDEVAKLYDAAEGRASAPDKKPAPAPAAAGPAAKPKAPAAAPR